MLQQGYCYIRLFAVKYRRQIAACLWQNPTFSKVEQQLGLHYSFRRGDSFFTTYISGPFLAHIAKSRKENPFHAGTLRRLNERMASRVGAEQPSPRSALLAPTPPTQRQPPSQNPVLEISQQPHNQLTPIFRSTIFCTSFHPYLISDPALFFCISYCKSCGCCGSPLPLSYPCQG